MFAKPRHFSPEQLKALRVLEDELSNIKQLTITSVPMLDELVLQDSKFFIHKKISTSVLPRTNAWLWNQSRARQTITDYTGNIHVSFFKLNTRNKNSHELSPNYKIWVFNITIQPNNKVISFVWCERGEIPLPIDIDVLKIEDFDFLAPFLCVPCAMEFGW